MERKAAKRVLNTLTAMKDCLDSGNTYTTLNGESFNLRRHNGICWHVFTNTPGSGVVEKFLKPAFEKMGLNPDYPVEYQITGGYCKAASMHWAQQNLYDKDAVMGKLRYKLLCDLIEYFNKVLDDKM